jgi:hypothetical protein
MREARGNWGNRDNGGDRDNGDYGGNRNREEN